MNIVWGNKVSIPADIEEYNMLIDMWAEDTKHLADDIFGSAFALCRKKCDFAPTIAKFLEMAEEARIEKKNRPLTNEELQKKCDDDAEQARRSITAGHAAADRLAISYGYDPKKWQGVTQVGEEWLKRIKETAKNGARKETTRRFTDV
jgi:hypothetical protein